MSAFVKDLLERAVKTAAQTAVALLGAGAVNVLELDWAEIASVSAGAALVSVLTSIASYKVGVEGTASLVNE